MIQQSSRSGYDDLGSVFKGANLNADVLSAIDRQCSDAFELPYFIFISSATCIASSLVG